MIFDLRSYHLAARYFNVGLPPSQNHVFPRGKQGGSGDLREVSESV